ncbi:type II toxin-antitoxin system Phd/YefM family antitoxin [Endozoicomonas gorgoniicola]|uniref:Type II toxin-antitoxin system Phd/YefM family antitoxin n=1 Tax=Endozoicomonas gorgoniicola TaxID=1234144 RepID=A0ABT3MUX8_9GAMM|nr:type II toxin-antitoxin system Phd/YefM family antitoxin [Endozoicomonas gorgoniicola]MCW7553172.1 type II toxin-antitoxin system Phd/YefM family antitoxin [Endozoicomonas gorgoniicola]
MSITTISSRAFNQNVTEAKRSAMKQPVFITDRGSITHVLLNIDEYQLITRNAASILELLAMPEAENTDFEVEPLENSFLKPADFS